MPNTNSAAGGVVKLPSPLNVLLERLSDYKFRPAICPVLEEPYLLQLVSILIHRSQRSDKLVSILKSALEDAARGSLCDFSDIVQVLRMASPNLFDI